jgi:hypothetical protein
MLGRTVCGSLEPNESQRQANTDSGKELADDVAFDVGEAEVSAGVAVGQAFVVQAPRLQVQDVDIVSGDVVAGSPVEPYRKPHFVPPPASHIVKPSGLWSQRSLVSAVGCRRKTLPHLTSVTPSNPCSLGAVRLRRSAS